MSEKMEARFRQMEIKKKQLISLISTLPFEKYMQQPDPKSWSVGQAANHLYLSEKLSLAYLRKKLNYPDTVPKFHFKSWIGIFFYKYIIRFTRAKAPRHINMWEGQLVLPPDQLDQQWNELRVEMKNFITDQLPRFKDHLVYNHPFAGRLTFNQMLLFFNDHIDHHTKQIHRILKKIQS